ncbi:MAG: hypothetical protein ACM31C_25630 [Acidobacteriota bacterium]
MRMHDRRRLLDKLLRELLRSETQAIEHAPREARRLGEVTPVVALHDVANHAKAMRPRLLHVLDGHALAQHASGLVSSYHTIRQLVVDHIYDAERSYRGALLDLRHGIDVVRVLREAARLEELFALIRWCDDWLTERRRLVASVEAQLGWFAEPEARTTAHPAPADPREPQGGGGDGRDPLDPAARSDHR